MNRSQSHYYKIKFSVVYIYFTLNLCTSQVLVFLHLSKGQTNIFSHLYSFACVIIMKHYPLHGLSKGYFFLIALVSEINLSAGRFLLRHIFLPLGDSFLTLFILLCIVANLSLGILFCFLLIMMLVQIQQIPTIEASSNLQ